MDETIDETIEDATTPALKRGEAPAAADTPATLLLVTSLPPSAFSIPGGGGVSGLAAADRREASPSPAAVYLASLSVGSRRAMAQALEVIAFLIYKSGSSTAAAAAEPASPAANPPVSIFAFPWQQVRYVHAAAIRAALMERYAPATASKMLCALRGTLKAAWRLGLMSAEDYQAARDVGSVTGESLPAGRSVASGELLALMSACQQDRGPAGRRDAAILALLYGCGLRRAELVALDLPDYSPAEEVLRVRGKRNKQRQVPIVGGAQAALQDWLAARGESDGPLFLPIRKGAKVIEGQRLTTQAVYHILAERAKEAGVASFSPHDLRRTFVGDLLDAGADIATVQKLAGHASVNTTARYDRRGERAKKRAAQMLHVPYQKR